MNRIGAILAAGSAAACLLPMCAHAQARPACDGPAYELARRFVGVWQEFTVASDGEKLEGTLRSVLEAGDCAITQQFRSADGHFSFRSLGYVDPASGQWLETYVLSNGRVAIYRWRNVGNDIVFDRIAGGDPAFNARLRVSFVDSDAYRVIEERSPLGEDAWTPVAQTMTRRIR